jgi:hypothetical protein
MFEDSYRRMNENVTASRDLIEKTIELAQRRNKRHKLAPAAILVALILVLSGTALAAKVTTGDWLGFVINTDKTVDFQELVTNPGESIVCGDYRITLRSAVGDDSTYFILYDLDTVSGKPLIGEDLTPMTISDSLPADIYLNHFINTSYDDLGGWGVASSVIRIDDGSNPAKASFIQCLQFSNSGQAPEWIKLSVKSIDAIINDNNEQQTVILAEGDWQIVISGQTNTDRVEYRIGDSIIRVTPLSISIYSNTAQMEMNSGIKLEMDNGSTMSISEVSDLSGFEDRIITDWQMTAVFSSVIDPEQVVAIFIDGERISLK